MSIRYDNTRALLAATKTAVEQMDLWAANGLDPDRLVELQPELLQLAILAENIFGKVETLWLESENDEG